MIYSLKTTAFSSFFLLLLLSVPSFLSAQKAPAAKVTILEVREEIGPAINRYVELGLENARETGADYVLIDMDTYGGALKDADDIRKRILDFDKPVFVTHYPVEAKAFYMEPNEDNPKVVNCTDLLAPEGYGEICGGSERMSDHDKLLERIRHEELPEEAFKWYLELRKYGSVPHSGFGMGVERVVAWLCGIEHIREAIPFPRTIKRVYP